MTKIFAFGCNDAIPPKPPTDPRIRAMIPSFCVVLPMFNEECSAEASIRGIAGYLSGVETRTAIVAVEDGGKDRTLEVLRRLARDIPRLTVISHEKNRGYGAANRTGYAAAIQEGFDYVLVMDADGTQAPEFIGRFFEPMRASVDFIKATRYARGGSVAGVKFNRWFISWAGNKFAKLVLRLPLTDYTNGFRAIKTSILARMQCREPGFAMLIEEVAQAKKLGASFAEVPYQLTARAKEESASKFVYSWRVCLGYLRNLFWSRRSDR